MITINIIIFIINNCYVYCCYHYCLTIVNIITIIIIIVIIIIDQGYDFIYLKEVVDGLIDNVITIITTTNNNDNK